MSLSVDLRRRLGTLELAVRFEQPASGVTALFGPSGAGKTSVLHMIAGLLAPQQGRIVLGDRILLDSDAGLCVPAPARRLACVFQDARLFPHLSVRSNLFYGMRRSPAPLPAESVDAIIGLLGLGDLLARRPRGLSGGERQRVAIGRALLANPDMLLLDEPLAALDPERRDEIMGYLERLRDDTSIPMLYVTHRREEMARLADQVVMLDAGRIVARGSTAEVLTDSGLARRFVEPPSSVLIARIGHHDETWGLTRLDCGGLPLVLPRLDAAEGSRVRIAVRAADVLIALRPPDGLSASNTLAATVTGLADADPTWTDATLDIAGQPLAARITRASRHRLDLQPGQRVFALIKTATLA
jgi:molybdate transport system ATP-binding protein